jgi:hypothetical protein
MIGRLRDAFGDGTGTQAADAAVGRGMADLLAALDSVIDDDAALGRVYAGRCRSVPGTAPGPAAPRRRMALGAMAGAAAVLIAGAVALAAVVVPGTGRGGAEGPAATTAYVVKRVDSALSAAGPGEIAQMTVTSRSGAVSGGQTVSSTSEEWSYGDRWRVVTYSAAGRLRYDEAFGPASGSTVVSYLTRTWARKPAPGRDAVRVSGPGGCGRAVAALPLLLPPGLPRSGLSAGSLSATVARDLRAAVSCGTLAAAGRQWVNGIDAIELTSSPDSMLAETVWVSPGTYLPVRLAIRPAAGQPGPWQTAAITWLPPTTQNLAKLTMAIPAGFRQVPFAQAVEPTMQHIPG